MKAMILAAGYGRRLRPLTNFLPKPLLPLGRHLILSYIINFMKNNGIEEVMINLHHLASLLKKRIGNGEKWGLKIHYSYEPKILGTAGGIKKAERFFKGEKYFLVLNADIVFKLNLARVIRFHEEKKAVVTLVLRQDRKLEKYGVIEIDSQGQIVKFLKHQIKQERYVRLYRTMFTGIQLLSPEVLEYVSPAKYAETTGELYPFLLKKGCPVYGCLNRGYWRDLGTREEYFSVNGEKWVWSE
ncbi:MAG: NDP-sugar synthase [Candidatus Zixiibacteriota bacterium]